VILTVAILGMQSDIKEINEGPDVIGTVEEIHHLDNNEVHIWLDNGEAYHWTNNRELPIREGSRYAFYINDSDWYGRNKILRADELHILEGSL
jgi:hypothetical protein